MSVATTVDKPAVSSEDLLAKLFTSMNVDGVYGRTGAYEDVVEGLGRYITSLRPQGAEVFRFPPVVSRALKTECAASERRIQCAELLKKQG